MSYKHLAEALLLGRPYFGAALRARQGVAERHQYFLPVVSTFGRGGSPLEVLEVGSWAGASTVTWTLALREAGREGKVTCVDPWEPYFEVEEESGQHYRQMNAAAAEGLISRLFEHNLRATGVAEMVEARRGTSRQVLPGFPPDRFDIVYIDGSHAFEDAAFDIREAKRLLRDGGVICGDDLEIEACALPGDELPVAIESNRDYIFSESARKWYHPGVTGAVAREFPAVAVWNGFWAVRRCGAGWVPFVLDPTGLHVPAHLQELEGTCRLVESTADYDLVEAGGRYFGVARTIGSVDLFEEMLGDRALPPVLLAGDSLEAVRREVKAMSPSGTASSSPVLTGSYRGFNLVTYGGRTYALRQSLGPVDVTEGETELRRRFGNNDILVSDSSDIVRVGIDAIASTEELAALRAEMAAIRAEAAIREKTMQELRSGLDAISDPLQFDEIRTAIQELRSGLDGIWQQHRSEAAIRETTMQELRSGLDGISQQHRLVARQVSLLQYGPGDPGKPCLAGDHRGFTLVHYQGRVYGLRKPLDPTEVQWNDLELAHAGANEAISGYSVDGVCARIDILEDARELHAELASLDQELLATNSRLTEGLRQANAALQTSARDLERLARNWPNRFLRRFSK